MGDFFIGWLDHAVVRGFIEVEFLELLVVTVLVLELQTVDQGCAVLAEGRDQASHQQKFQVFHLSCLIFTLYSARGKF